MTQRANFTPEQRQQLENSIKDQVEKQLKKRFASMQELIAFYQSEKTRGMIDWHTIDQNLNRTPYANNKSFCYKYFAETIIPNYYTPWPEYLLVSVDNEVKALLNKNKAKFVGLSTRQAYTKQRKLIMDEVVFNLDLKNKEHSYKKIQDRMRNLVDDQMKAECKDLQKSGQDSDEEVTLSQKQVSTVAEDDVYGHGIQHASNSAQMQKILGSFKNFELPAEFVKNEQNKFEQVYPDNNQQINQVPVQDNQESVEQPAFNLIAFDALSDSRKQYQQENTVNTDGMMANFLFDFEM
ncbi:Hypothetical_protein [Hexamita inflata]|uniref:Hypothetical_protein n=1 Tax=Hexamita inflata TaxID=28002 RepID=A0AA86N9S9_9EUKA|nr:Hypothetical protein HINF_LOCUS2674 [Hexamita inflata]